MIRCVLLLALSWPLAAQAPAVTLPSDFFALGAGWNQYAAPQIAGWASYAKSISQAQGLYSFSSYDITSSKTRPFTIQTSVRTGVAYCLRTAGPVSVWGIGDAGMAASGESIGGAFSGGGMFAVSLGKGWAILVPVRILRTSIGGTQTIYELGIGWGR